MANQQHHSGSTDIIKDSLTTAVTKVVSSMEPQIEEFATKVAQQAVDRSKDLATQAYKRVQKQPWYLIGIAAFLLVAAAVFLGFEAADDDLIEA